MERKDTYVVDLWGSPPSEDNDDCWCGHDFDNLFEALCLFYSPWGKHDGFDSNRSATAVIVLDGPGVHLERSNPDFIPDDGEDDRMWRREIAMEAGMAFGCEAFNDIMGWS